MHLPTFFLSSVFALVFSSPTLASAIDKSSLYGSWVCEHSLGNNNKNLQVNFIYHVNVNKNGTSTGEATLTFSMAALPPLIYQEVDTALWTLDRDNLTISSDNIQFSNMSHPEYEALLNLQQHFPRHVNETLKVTQLTKLALTLFSERYNDVYHCVR